MERLMQFVWQHRLVGGSKTVDGKTIHIIDQGIPNADAGPDFFNATIEIGKETWVGNIEIHVRASDWYRHHHDKDPAYDSVILHVVQFNDTPVYRSNGAIIPQMAMNCSPETARRCNAMIENAQQLPCEKTIRSLPHIYHTDWLTALAMERLYNKSERILEIVGKTGGHWEGAAYITLARGLGFGLNSEPFEILAKNLPLKFLNRHHDDLITTEALIFGQAGLIPDRNENEDTYTTRLRSEYQFMAHKFSLTPPPLSWKFSRTRPQNFPHRRLAFLAQMIHRGFYLIGNLDDSAATACNATIDQMRKLFNVELIGFWTNHYNFAGKGGCTPRALSNSSIDTLLINVAIPLLHARATARNDFDKMNLCAELLQCLKSEDNRITRLFADAGIDADSAFTSQALIELRREYCEKKKCLYCRFGHRMLSAEFRN